MPIKKYRPRRQSKIVKPATEHQFLFSVEQAADALSVGTCTIREWVNSGALPVVSLPSVRGTKKTLARVLIAREDIVEFLRLHRKAVVESAVRDVTKSISKGAVSL